MSYTSNMGVVIDKLNVKLKGMKNQDKMLRDIAVSLATSNVDRIHTDGKNVAGGKIGTYKPSTMRIRRTSGKIQANKTGTDIILSFTTLLSKQFQAGAIPGGWGAGFIAKYGSDLFEILTKKFGEIWGISASDKQAIDRIVSKEIKRQIG